MHLEKRNCLLGPSLPTALTGVFSHVPIMAGDHEKLINLVQNIELYPCFYDYTRSDFDNDRVKSAAWDAISKEINIPGNNNLIYLLI